MRLPLLLLIVTGVIGLAVWWIFARQARPPFLAKSAEQEEVKAAPAPAASIAAAQQVNPPAPESPMPPSDSPLPPGASSPQPNISEQRAYRFLMNDGKLSLEAVEEIRGDFHRRRGEPVWLPGMLCYRLLDASERVLAEVIASAPDHVCVVLDPHTVDADDEPLPAQLTPPGPVVFQVRMPKVEAATQMKIYRVTGPQPAGVNAAPPMRLLATIPLAQ